MNTNKYFTYMLTSLWISVIGSGIYRISAIWLLSNYGAKEVVFFGIAGALPLVFMGLVTGSLIDKFDKLKILFYSDVLRMIIVIMSLILIFYYPVPEIIIVANMLVTIFSLAYQPAMASWIPQLTNDLTQRNKMNSSLFLVFGITLFVGPAVGGWIATNYSIEFALMINTLTFAVSSSLTLFVMKIIPKDSTTKKIPKSNTKNVFLGEVIFNIIKKIPGHTVETFKGIGNGIKYLLKVKYILFFVIAFPFIESIESVFPLILPLAIQDQQLNANLYGTIMSILGLSLIVGTLLARLKIFRKNIERFLAINFLLQSIGMILIAFGWPNVFIVLLGICFMGIPSGIAQVTFSTFIQKNVPRDYLGRMFGVIHSFSSLLQPLSPIIIIPFAGTNESANLFYVLAIIMCIAGISTYLGIKKLSGSSNVPEKDLVIEGEK